MNCEYVAEMIDYCEENNIKSFAELCRYARRKRKDDWLRAMVNTEAVAFVMVHYLKSKREE